MFYTQRRASVEEPGVAWVHGSRIGVARSADALDWRYAGTVAGLELGDGPETHWAPEVIDDGERYRMYLTVDRRHPRSLGGASAPHRRVRRATTSIDGGVVGEIAAELRPGDRRVRRALPRRALAALVQGRGG